MQAVAPNTIQCQVCKTNGCIETVALPFVFKYLAVELAAMNIQLKVSLT
jgi:DNA-directed RNA polymerase I subunit RPA2